MTSEQQLAGFIRSIFRSVWTLELLLFLKKGSGRGWSRAELVQGLRASESIISTGTDALLAAGLIIVENDGAARYRPVSPDLEALANDAETLYAQRPDAVRRLIVGATSDGITAFADAFRLRRD
jgi:hypothetical protein